MNVSVWDLPGWWSRDAVSAACGVALDAFGNTWGIAYYRDRRTGAWHTEVWRWTACLPDGSSLPGSQYPAMLRAATNRDP